jgi:NADPH:quinone reductase
MRAFTLDSLEIPPALREDLPAPAPTEGQILVRVHASSANPVDNAIAAGMLAGMAEHTFPIVLGRDFAGVVEQVGAGAGGYAAGDEVFGFVPHADPDVHDGGWAEHIAVAADGIVATVPAGVDLATAGAAPLAGITALAAIDALELSEGDTLLVVGATGGVGSLAVQLAAAAGATVVAPALPEDEAFLRDLGVSEVLPRDGDVSGLGADALLDTVSYAPGAFDAALKVGARIASPNGAAGDGPGRANVMASAHPELLPRVGELLAGGSLRIPVQATYDLAQAGDALAALAGAHTQGKRAIRIA